MSHGDGLRGLPPAQLSPSSPFRAAPQPQLTSPVAGGAAAGAAVGLAVPADKPLARCFTVQMMEVVWQRGSNGAREPTIAPHRSIISRPVTLKDFQQAVYVWAGVQPGKVRTACYIQPRRTARRRALIERWLPAALPQLTFTVGGSQEPLQESNYHSLETEHDILVELVDDDAPADEDINTVDGLKARRERLSTGESACSRCAQFAWLSMLCLPTARAVLCRLGPSVSEL